jgi:radical SAM superfamily enzyme YgiQ (UPF0313 family)
MIPFHAVIVSLNSKYVHSSLAAWYLLAGVEKYCKSGVTAGVAEGTVNEDIDTVAERILEKKPDIIGLSCYIWNIAFVKKLLPVLKKALPDAVVVLGGPEVSYNAGEILRDEPLVDYVLSGEGELPFALLLDAISSGRENDGSDANEALTNAVSGTGTLANETEKSVRVIPGISCRGNGEIAVSPPYCPADDPPDPYGGAYFAALKGRIAYLETSRGCPFSCAFCLSGRQGGVRYFDMDRAKRDILLLANSGTQTIKLVDRTFNADRRRAYEIFRFVIESCGTAVPEGVRFHFEIAGDLLDEETLALLETAPKGLLQFEIGLQSFNEKTLMAIRRKTDTERLKRNIERLILPGNIHIHIDLIAGLPYEDMESIAGSFAAAYALQPHMLQLGFLKLLHGAAMREEPGNYPCRHSPHPPYEVTETPWLTADDLQKLRAAEDALERLYNSGRFRRTLLYVLRQTGAGPLALFMAAGAYTAERLRPAMTLDDYTERIFEYFGALEGVDGAALRDAMACDRLATNSAGRLPPFLQNRDSRRKAVMTAINGAPETRLQKGVKRCFVLLSAENAAVWADYTDRDSVTGEYMLRKISLDLL